MAKSALLVMDVQRAIVDRNPVVTIDEWVSGS
jgi:hypothetical protein